jgi:glycosyltransferase involved in cell wall biosynthesis
VFNTVAVQPRFSVVIAATDRADVIGRAVAAVLAQTFANIEVLVVDGSTDETTATAVRTVSDERVRLLRHPGLGGTTARHIGMEAARGRWIALLEPDDEVVPGWLARLGRIVDSTDAELVCCGGEQLHSDGSLTRVLPEVVHGIGSEGTTLRACFRPGAFVFTRRLLIDTEGFDGDGRALEPDEFGPMLLSAALDSGHVVAHTPEPLVRWNERMQSRPTPTSHSLRLMCSLQGLEALARTPIPDSRLLTRYAVDGGVAAARLRDREQARRLFRLARKLEPRVARHWARSIVVSVPPLADRVWTVDAPSEQLATVG